MSHPTPGTWFADPAHFRRPTRRGFLHVGLVGALSVEAAHFVACVRDGVEPMTGGEAGLHVVRLLEAATESMAHQGRLIDLRSLVRP